MIAEGADIVDVGGESTRPGAEPVAEDEELSRVIPVVEALAGQVRVSVDTTKEAVADAAVAAGATLINDVSASLWPTAARHGVGWVAMHRLGTAATMQLHPHYDDVATEVASLLFERATRATSAGVDEVWIDPGIGFGKTLDHNLSLLGALADLVSGAYPVMVGTSRKSFLGVLSARPGQPPVPVDDAAPGVAGHGHLGHGPRGPDGPGPRRGRHRAGRPTGGRLPIGVDVVKGKWAAGIPPRNFTWVIKDRLAMSERPGRLRPQPPQGAPAGGDHLAPGPGVQPGGVAPALLAQPAGL